ncbi:hypothetical protein P280DRAFT_478265 [Massarina eburnea CBS 473.64]|uniref:Uncharacterized protein n=1 Tax=Massarina eburnea CBS 473.64 TaxID=1395130 RepID=A0A6A6S779_9PLEO|nr:hypothetical protein P280DRAFT_478265 [Massarina eburnea CBS 473.64]
MAGQDFSPQLSMDIVPRDCGLIISIAMAAKGKHAIPFLHHVRHHSFLASIVLLSLLSASLFNLFLSYTVLLTHLHSCIRLSYALVLSFLSVPYLPSYPLCFSLKDSVSLTHSSTPPRLELVELRIS